MKKLIILSIFFCCSIVCRAQAPDSASVSGRLPFLKDGDTVVLTLYQYGHFENLQDFKRNYKCVVKAHSFKISFTTIGYPQYFDLWLSAEKRQKNLQSILVEGGDEINLDEQDSRYRFSGKGSELPGLSYNLQHVYRRYATNVHYSDTKAIAGNLVTLGNATAEQLTFLDANRAGISSSAAYILRASVLAEAIDVKPAFYRFLKRANDLEGMKVLNEYDDRKMMRTVDSLVKDTSAIQADYLAETLLDRYQFDSCDIKHSSFSIRKAYQYFTTKYKGDLKDELLMLLLFNSNKTGEDISPMLDSAIQEISDPGFKNVVLALKAGNVIGAEAYDFSLTDTMGNRHSFDEFRGKVVLLDFWYTGCPVCAETSPYLTAVEAYFKDKPVAFISICIDKNKAMWQKSITDGKYTGPGAINLYTNGNGEDDFIIRRYEISGYPTLILIDQQGRLAKSPGDLRPDRGKHLVELISKELRN